MSKKQPVTFDITPAKELPKRKYLKGSKYDDVLDSFLAKNIPLGSIRVTRDESDELLDANYLRTQLKKRISARRLDNIVASVVNNVCYLSNTSKK